VLPGTNTTIPYSESCGGRHIATRASNGSLGSTDAQGRRRSRDAMASRVLHMAPTAVHRDPGLAVCRDQFHGRPRPSTTRGGGMGGGARYALLGFDVFYFFCLFRYMH